MSNIFNNAFLEVFDKRGKSEISLKDLINAIKKEIKSEVIKDINLQEAERFNNSLEERLAIRIEKINSKV